MIRDQEVLIRRVLAHVDARTTDMDDATSSVPVEHYVDPARHADELDALFRRRPLAVAHVSQLAAPGDFVTVDVAARSVLVVRADDGALFAHLNVCRHRGTRLVDAASGTGCMRFACPYHGWTYAADGRLVGIPHRPGFPGVDEHTHALRSVAVREHGGFVWLVPPDTEPAAWLGDLTQLFDDESIATHTVYDVRDVARPLDWKLAIDIFLEAYHLRTTHADTIFPMFFDNLGLVDRIGPHLRNVFAKRSIVALRDADPSTWRLRDHANVLVHVFPNTLVLFEPDHLAVLHVYPQGPGRCRVHSYSLLPDPPQTAKARAYWDANNAILYGATDEDFARGESIQASIASGANTVFTFGRYEHALTHFHAGITHALAR